MELLMADIVDVAMSKDCTLVILHHRNGFTQSFKFAVPERCRDWAKYGADRSQKKTR